MINIEEFKDQINVLLAQIDSNVESIQQELTNNKKPIADFVKKKDIPGVYAFFIKPKTTISIYTLEDVWLDKNIINFPKIVRSRFQASTTNTKKFYTFYLGKSEKVNTRLNEHITHTSHITTYSLKLKDRTDFLNKNDLYYAKFEMPELVGLDPSIIQLIITRFESKLRGRLNPWVGKQ